MTTGWYTNKEFGYKILLTVPPEVLPGVFGQSSGIVSSTDNDGTIAISIMPMPINSADAKTVITTLDNACESAVRSVSGNETSRSSSKIQGFTGREVTATLPGGKAFRHRFFLAHGNLYQLEATGPLTWVDSSDTKKLLDSFTLLK